MYFVVKVSLLLFFIFLPLSGADLNTTIADGNAKVYTAIYQKISSDSNQSDENKSTKDTT